MTSVQCVGCGFYFTSLDDSGLCYRCQSNASGIKIKVSEQKRFDVCRACGVSLRDKKPGAQFCSSACKQKFRRAQKRTKDHICEWCDSQFQSSRTDARYCSSACKQAAYRFEKGRHAINLGYVIPVVHVEED